MKTIQLMTDAQWCQYTSARDSEGNDCHPESEAACQWCLTSWMNKFISQRDEYDLKPVLIEEANKRKNAMDPVVTDLPGAIMSLALWNDSNYANVAAVNELFRAVNKYIEQHEHKSINSRSQSSGW